MQTIPERLEYWAQVRPEETFCEFVSGSERQSISFAQLFERSRAYAAWYRDRGVAPGAVVVIILKHTPHLFYSYLGAILAGAVPTFMPFPSNKQRPEFYWADHRTLFARLEPALLVTYEENAREARTTAPGLNVEIAIACDEIFDARGDRAAQPVSAADPDDIACLQHSSGTTSLKKGVMLTHRAIVSQVEAYGAALAFTQRDRIASWLPLYHDMGFIACFMTSVVQGTFLVMLDPFEWVVRPHLLLDEIERCNATFCWLPNFAFAHLVNAVRPGRRWDLSCVRAFINCSEPCKAETFERFASRFAECAVTPAMLQVCYAMAENVFAVTQTPPGQAVRDVSVDAQEYSLGRIAPVEPDGAAVRILSCGIPVDGVRVRVCATDGAPLPDRAVGEIFVGGPFLFTGYYRLPERTAERLRNGWYATGDMGFLLDGELFVTGRVDDMLIVNGRNYYAHEIEAIVNGVPGAIAGRNVAVGVEDTKSGGLAVVVLAECAPDVDRDSVTLHVRQRVLERLGLAVQAVVPVPAGSLVKTTSGKLSRSKNKQLFLESTT